MQVVYKLLEDIMHSSLGKNPIMLNDDNIYTASLAGHCMDRIWTSPDEGISFGSQ